MRMQIFAGASQTKDTRQASTRAFSGISQSELEEHLRTLALEYKTADYFPNRQVVIVIDPDLPNPLFEQVENLRKALIASGVKEGLVDAIQRHGFEPKGNV